MANVTVETTPEDTASGRPFRAKCAECGWKSWGYVNIHAAQNLADSHRCTPAHVCDLRTDGAGTVYQVERTACPACIADTQREA